MFHFHDPLWIVSQVFGLATLVCFFYAMIVKCKIRTLWALVFGNLFYSISVAFIGNWVLVGIFGAAAFRDVVFIWVDKREYPKAHSISLIALWLFLSITIISTVLPMVLIAGTTTWLNWVILFGALMVTTSNWVRNIHFMRLARVFIASFAIVNSIHFSNFTALLIDGMSIISVFIFYVIMIYSRNEVQPNEPARVYSGGSCKTKHSGHHGDSGENTPAH